MGYRTVVPKAGAIKTRNDNNTALFSSLHRAIITDVNVEKGTVKVRLESVRYEAELLLPMLALSIPSAPVNNRSDYAKSSWGRYIPQIGDILLTGFSPNGELYAIGHTPLNYEFFNLADQDQYNQEKGGIGWSGISRAELKPGDWDFKSSRNSTFYLGDRARLTSGVSSFTANSTEQTANISAPLISQNCGSSYSRFGAVKRTVIPASPEEFIIAVPPFTRYGQECSMYVNTFITGTPPIPTLSLARLTLGDVVDDLTGQMKLPTINPAMPLRYYLAAYNSTYLLPAYEATIDALGNKQEEAMLAMNMKWNTPLATWDVTNASTSFLSSADFSVTSPAIKLGGDAAVFSLVLGETLQSGMTSFLTAVNAAGITAAGLLGTPATDGATMKAYVNAVNAACLVLQTSVNSMLSLISKTA